LRGGGVALIGAGVGVTPVRALLEDLPAAADTIVLLRASTREQLMLAEEIGDLARERNGRALALLGSREEIVLGTEALRTLIPDLPLRDVFICGPGPFTKAVASAARSAGLPAAQLHIEGYGD
jgi:ferredoxin-NADP reductase